MAAAVAVEERAVGSRRMTDRQNLARDQRSSLMFETPDSRLGGLRYTWQSV